jgi:hypothetical protein
MRAFVCSQVQERSCACLEYFEALVTIAMEGVDVDIRLLVKMKNFIEEQCAARMCLIERGGALMHMHFQMAMKGNFTSLRALNKNNLRFV